MNIQLSDFFEYVFGGRINIDVDNVPDHLKAAKKQEKIITIQKKFAFITQDKMLSAEFRSSLRELKSTNLEKALYGNNDDDKIKAVSDTHRFPSNEDIKNQFKKLDKEYGYFATTETAEAAYQTLFKACKLIADYAECNNANHNEVAYIHAYKLLVLFGDKLNNVDSFIKSYNFSSLNKPVHDLLVRDIPKNDPPIDLKAWQVFIAKSGPQAIAYFQQAPAIQKVLQNKAPKTLLEAEEAASQISYERYKEHPTLARLCVQYKAREEVFNRCLDTKPKQSDNLPNIITDGALVNQPGYYLVKLPVDDPRAYILGLMTNCCQSIGGHSEQCVIDGITRANNGFYVLLQATNKALPKPPVVNGKIDYDHYTIVG